VKPTIREKLLVRLDALERQRAGETLSKSPPVNRVKPDSFPTMSMERWESLAKAARDPDLKLRRQAIISTD
jgi:hypothetical protein